MQNFDQNSFVHYFDSISTSLIRLTRQFSISRDTERDEGESEVRKGR